MDNYNIIIVYVDGTIDEIISEEITETDVISLANKTFNSRIGVDKVIVTDNDDKTVYTIEL